MTASEQSADESVADALWLLALSNGLLDEYLVLLQRLRVELAALLTASSPPDRAPSPAAIASLIVEVDRAIERTLLEIAALFTDHMEQVAAVEHERQRWLMLLFGVSLSAAFDARAVALQPIAGVTIADAMNRISDSLKYSVGGLVQRSAALGQSGAETARQLDGGGPLMEPSVFAPVQRQLEVLVRTQTAGVAGQSRLQPIDSPVMGWQHISVIDGRTSGVCLARAFKVWNSSREPVGHSLVFAEPPLHPNCRSRLAVVDITGPVTAFSLKQWAERSGHAQLVRLFGAQRVEQWGKGVITMESLLHSRAAITLEEFKAAAETAIP